MNGRGITGFIDPSAGPAESYEALFALRDRGELTLRAGYRIPAQVPGSESEWFKGVMAFRPPRHDDGLVSFLGLGENIVFAINDGVRMGPGFNPEAQAQQELVEVATFAAERRIPIEIHAYTDDSADGIIEAFEEVAKSHDLHGLRWTVAHLDTGSANTLAIYGVACDSIPPHRPFAGRGCAKTG